MRTRGYTSIGIATAIIITASAVWAAERSAEPSSGGWQHLALDSGPSVKDAELAGKINDLGRKGWELVTVTPVNQDGATKSQIYYFKKPLN
jgi:hypothetical protein